MKQRAVKEGVCRFNYISQKWINLHYLDRCDDVWRWKDGTGYAKFKINHKNVSGGQFIWGRNPQTSIGEMEPNGTDRTDDNMGWLWTLSGIPDVFKAKYGVNYFLKSLSFSKKE